MNTYRCYVVGRESETTEVVQANSSFEARRHVAEKRAVPPFEVVAVRDALREGRAS